MLCCEFFIKTKPKIRDTQEGEKHAQYNKPIIFQLAFAMAKKSEKRKKISKETCLPVSLK